MKNTAECLKKLLTSDAGTVSIEREDWSKQAYIHFEERQPELRRGFDGYDSPCLKEFCDAGDLVGLTHEVAAMCELLGYVVAGIEVWDSGHPRYAKIIISKEQTK